MIQSIKLRALVYAFWGRLVCGFFCYCFCVMNIIEKQDRSVNIRNLLRDGDEWWDKNGCWVRRICVGRRVEIMVRVGSLKEGERRG